MAGDASALPEAGIPRVLVVGLGGAGIRVVDRLTETGTPGVAYAAVDTEARAVHASLAPRKLALGERLTRGLGAGGNATIGERAAEESAEELFHLCSGADMVCIAAGLGGGQALARRRWWRRSRRTSARWWSEWSLPRFPSMGRAVGRPRCAGASVWSAR